MASLGLRFDLLSRGARDAERDLDRLGNASEQTGGRVRRLGQALAIGVGGAALGGIAAFTAGLKGGLDEAISYQKITDQLTQTIKSTGGAAGVSTSQLKTYAGELEALSGVDEELILKSQNVLLTFTKIRNEVGAGNDVFNQASEAALNMATTLGTDVSGAAVQVGKALNDPLKGITALSKAGVSFTVQQKEQIKTLVQAGDTLGAQKVILGELTTQFGGAAEAAGKGLGGSISRLQDTVSDTFRTIATNALPTLQRLADQLSANLPGAIESTGNGLAFVRDNILPPFVAGLKLLVSTVSTAAGAIGDTIGFLNDNREVVVGLAAAYTTFLIPAVARLAAAKFTALIAQIGVLVFANGGLAASFRAAVVAAGPLIALSLGVGVLAGAIFKGRQEAERFSSALKDAGETKVTDPGFAAVRDQTVQTIAKLEEFGKAPERLREAKDALAALDSAANTSTTNIGLLADSFGLTNEQIVKLAAAAKIDLGTSNYAEARLGIEKYRAAADVAGTSSGKLAAAQQVLADKTATAGDKVKALTDAFNAFYGVALSASAANDRYQASLDAATDALSKNGRTLDAGTEKGRANREAIRGIIEASQAKAQADLEAGSSQERYNATLAEGRQRAREAAAAVGGNTAATRDFVSQLKLIPAVRSTEVKYRTTPGDALAKARALRESLNLIPAFKTATVNVVVNGLQTAEGLATKLNNIEGGSLRGSGPALTNTRSFGGASLRASNPGFVAAGQAAAVSFSVGFQQVAKPVAETVLKVSKDAREIAIGQMEKTLSALAERFEGAKDRFTQARDALLNVVNLRQDLIRSVAGTLRGSVSSLFEVTSVDEVLAKLSEQKTRLSNFLFDVANLRTRGVNNDLINQILSAGPEQAGNFAAALSTASSAQLGQVQGLQTQIAGLSGQAATSAGNATFGAQVAVARQSYEVQRVSLIELQRMVGQQERLLAETKALPVRTGQAVRAALTGAVR